MDMDEPERELSGDENDSKRPKTDGDDDASSSRRRERVHVSEKELHDQRFRAGDLLHGGEHPASFISSADLIASAAGKPTGTSVFRWNDVRAYRLTIALKPDAMAIDVAEAEAALEQAEAAGVSREKLVTAHQLIAEASAIQDADFGTKLTAYLGPAYTYLATKSPMVLKTRTSSTVTSDPLEPDGAIERLVEETDPQAFAAFVHDLDEALALRQMAGSHESYVATLNQGLKHTWPIETLYEYAAMLSSADEEAGVGDEVVTFVLKSLDVVASAPVDISREEIQHALCSLLQIEKKAIEVLSILPGCKVVTCTFKENKPPSDAAGSSSGAKASASGDSETVKLLKKAIGKERAGELLNHELTSVDIVKRAMAGPAPKMQRVDEPTHGEGCAGDEEVRYKLFKFMISKLGVNGDPKILDVFRAHAPSEAELSDPGWREHFARSLARLPTTAFEPCDLESLRDANGTPFSQQLKDMALDLLSVGKDRVASSLLALAFEEMDGDEARSVLPLVAALTFPEFSDLSMKRNRDALKTAFEAGLPEAHPLYINSFQRGDGLLPLSFASPFAMMLLATEGKVDMKTEELLFKNVNDVYNTKSKTLKEMSGGDKGTDDLKKRHLNTQRNRALLVSTAHENNKRAGLNAALFAATGQAPDPKESVTDRLERLDVLLGTADDAFDQKMTMAAVLAHAAVVDGSEAPPPEFDEALVTAEMTKIGTVGLRLDAPAMLAEMDGIVMAALLKLGRAGILFGSTQNVGTNGELDKAIARINKEPRKGKVVVLQLGNQGAKMQCGLDGRVIYSYPSLPLVYINIPPLKTSEEVYGEWAPYVLTHAPPHCLLAGLSAWPERYHNQTKLFAWQLGKDLPPYPDDEVALIKNLTSVSGEEEINDYLRPSFKFRSIASANARSAADASRAGKCMHTISNPRPRPRPAHTPPSHGTAASSLASPCITRPRPHAKPCNGLAALHNSRTGFCKVGGEEASTAELKTKLAEAIKAATDAKDCWEQIKGADAQKLLARFCRLAVRMSTTSLPAWPGDTAGRGEMRSWLRSHFPMSIVL